MKVTVDTRILSDRHCEKCVFFTVLKGSTHIHNVMWIMRQSMYSLPLSTM